MSAKRRNANVKAEFKEDKILAGSSTCFRINQKLQTVQNLLSELFTKWRNGNSVWSFSPESEVGAVVQLAMRNITQQIIRSNANAVTVSLHLKWSYGSLSGSFPHFHEHFHIMIRMYTYVLLYFMARFIWRWIPSQPVTNPSVSFLFHCFCTGSSWGMSVPLSTSAHCSEAHWDFGAVSWLLHWPDDSSSQQICTLQVSDCF